ncbi:hypothetical protein [Oceanobacillus alkalisoli]|uniref:hypothetical protein n=1 Tax=Oceanobacillus alkalisoli TaxID=2925113 RepID=UPI001EF02649|nr:hypothetical protein [Oceanobacillus alkalisoli]MCF3944724.1 hypothetical protein [Oceanobacillus alkalisoli]MCG5104328.1 hypothetical protein [Oceanobacillus alkalisoli]
MKYLMQAIEKQEAKLKLPVIRMEIDYELMNLYEAMEAGDKTEMIKVKERLSTLRHQLIEITEDENE